MAKIHHAYRQTSSRYKASYEHLNDHEYLGFSFKEVSSGKVYWDANKRTGEVEFDAGYTRHLRLTTSRPVTLDELRSVLYIYQKECACEHDCCGHYNGGAYGHLLKPIGRLHDGKARRWIIPVHYTPNL